MKKKAFIFLCLSLVLNLFLSCGGKKAAYETGKSTRAESYIHHPILPLRKTKKNLMQ